MNSKNNEFVSFQDDPKETFKDRLKTLIGERSVRGAAKDWGLSVSTLNNYLNRGTEPTLSVLETISSVENVSIDWLVKGIQAPKTLIQQKHQKDESRKTWMMIYDSLSNDEANDIMKFIHRYGVLNAFKTNQVSHIEPSDISEVIDSLEIRPTLKQAIKLALAGDESIDREILYRIEEKNNTNVSGGLNQDANNSKVG
ncbi:helix-turn-helix transcriptional regulator [Providencia rettgeri]|uniref:helix-turn-helix domain-containing protein n=1 Tax=Providencia rettgeri TaxID=587 RepID=UPI0030189E63